MVVSLIRFFQFLFAFWRVFKGPIGGGMPPGKNVITHVVFCLGVVISLISFFQFLFAFLGVFTGPIAPRTKTMVLAKN